MNSEERSQVCEETSWRQDWVWWNGSGGTAVLELQDWVPQMEIEPYEGLGYIYVHRLMKIEKHEIKDGMPPLAKGNKLFHCWLGGESEETSGNHILEEASSDYESKKQMLAGTSLPERDPIGEGNEGDGDNGNTVGATVYGLPDQRQHHQNFKWVTAIGAPSHRTSGAYAPPASFGYTGRGEVKPIGLGLEPTAGDSREGAGSQARFAHEAGGYFVSIDMEVHAPRQNDRASASDIRLLGQRAYERFRRVLERQSHRIEQIMNAFGRCAVERTGKAVTQARVVNEAGGRAVTIIMDDGAPQQSNQVSVAAARRTTLTKLLRYAMRRADNASAVGMMVTDDVGLDVQSSVSTIFGGFVILSFTNLIGTSKGDYPEFIRLGLYAGYVLLIVLTFIGLTSKKMAKHAIRVAAGMSIAAVTISALYEVSEKMYIKWIIGILGAMGTLAMVVIGWR